MARHKREQLLEQIKGKLKTHYPSLHLLREHGKVLIQGSFPVCVDGLVVDHFLIEIELQSDYPKSIPIVRELCGRIPSTADRHVYLAGNLCLFLLDERWKYWPRGSDIIDYLQNPLNDYFKSQLYYEQTGEWPFGERRHGADGIIDYYSEELGTSDIKVIIKFLQYLSKDDPKGHWPCYCESGQRMRNCHAQKMWEMRQKVAPEVAVNSLRLVLNKVRQILNR